MTELLRVGKLACSFFCVEVGKIGISDISLCIFFVKFLYFVKKFVILQNIKYKHHGNNQKIKTRPQQGHR